MMGACFIVWLAVLTATTRGYKSCSEISLDGKSPPYKIGNGGKSYDVSCNMSANPVATTIPVTAQTEPIKLPYIVDYGPISNTVLQELVKTSEGCRQTVTYDCKNDAQFTTKSNLQWFAHDDSGSSDWGDCEGSCKCATSGQSKVRILTKAHGIPIAKVYSDKTSNVNLTVGDLVCYGDTRDAVTLNNRNSFTSVNLTGDESSISFKFKSAATNKNVTIASIQLKVGFIKVRLNEQQQISIVHKVEITKKPVSRGFGNKIDREWHKVKMTMKKANAGVDVYVAVDEQKENILMENAAVAGRTKLVFGERDCRSFIGCVKDLNVGGKDVTKLLRTSPDKEYIVEGCQSVKDVLCSPSHAGGGAGTDKDGDTDDDNEDDDDDSDNTAVIVIVVILLLLLILLIVAFFITWYLKRNKGVYQTHEGSAEDIHGDNDNLTLVTKPSEQVADSQKSKEYYL